jgi:hypothetical protein
VTTRRFDAAEIGKNVRRDERGFLQVPAYVTRVGVQAYKRADGSTVLELRPPEEVFSYESLDTLRSAPVTDGHPAEDVDPSNVDKLEIGLVGSYSYSSGPFVDTTLSIRRGDSIKKVESGELFEASCGYSCDIEQTPGTWNGQRYDQIQRNIRYNHVALGPRGWARGGRDVSLRLDAADALITDAPPDNNDQRNTRNDSAGEEPGKESTMALRKVRHDGIEFEVSEQAATLIEKLQGSVTSLGGERDTQKKRADGLEAERDLLKEDLAKAKDPKVRQDALNARVELIVAATKVLGEADPAKPETRLDGLTDRQVHEKVLAKVRPDLKLEGRNDDYVSGAFTLAVGALPASTGGAAPTNTGLSLVQGAMHQPTTPTTREDANDKLLEEIENKRKSAWAHAQKGA